jgi:hypothetical protein
MENIRNGPLALLDLSVTLLLKLWSSWMSGCVENSTKDGLMA